MMNNTICAIATPPGMGAIALVRVSGNNAFEIVGSIVSDQSKFDGLFANSAKLFNLYDKAASHSDDLDRHLVDQVVITKYVSPHSFTGEDVVEISCHGSVYIQRKIVEMLIDCGCRMADPGEFTQRAFLNGKLDLPQAEAISDLVFAQTESSHDIAMRQLQGTLSKKMSLLRNELLQLSSLLELELDFSEEDVEFADRTTLNNLLCELDDEVTKLLASYKWGNALKNGVPVAIVGKPNTGKSTLMNALLERDRAIVSDIPGTTRDTIEDTFVIEGVLFRFIDTAGIRNSSDEIEMLGIERTFKTVGAADLILYLFDANQSKQETDEELQHFMEKVGYSDKKIVLVANKSDMLQEGACNYPGSINVSAKYGDNISSIITELTGFIAQNNSACNVSVVCNERHYYHLKRIKSAISEVKEGLSTGRTSDLLAEDVKIMLHDVGEITGELSTDDILDNIFSNFCIGK